MPRKSYIYSILAVCYCCSSIVSGESKDDRWDSVLQSTALRLRRHEFNARHYPACSLVRRQQLNDVTKCVCRKITHVPNVSAVASGAQHAKQFENPEHSNKRAKS